MKHLNLFSFANLLAGALLSVPSGADAGAQTPEQTLEETLVIGSKIEVPIRQVGASVSVLDAEDIELRGYTTLQELLRTQTSITAVNSGGAGRQTSLSIRGEAGFRTLILIDGIDTSDASTPQVGPLIEHISTGNDIERVEVLRGPQGFVYGADAGGVISLFTKEATSVFEGQINAEAGAFDTTSVDGYIAGQASLVNYFLSVNNQRTNGFNARVDDTSNEDDGYNNTTVHAKLGLDLAKNLNLKLVHRDTNANTEFDNCFDASFARSDFCDSDFDQDISRAALDYQSDKIQQHAAFSLTRSDRSSFTDGALSFDAESRIEKFEYLGAYQVFSALKIVTGIDFEEESALSSGERSSRDQLGVFSELQGNVNDALYLSIGTRYDDNDDFGQHLSTRLSIAYLLELGNNTLKFRSSAGNGFRAPSISEIVFNQNATIGPAADTVLREENSRGLDLGIEYYTDKGGEYKLGFFRQEIEDQIFFDLINFSGFLQAEGETNVQGVEFELRQPLAAQVFAIGNLTFNETEDNENLQRIRQPRLRGNIGLESLWLDQRLSLIINLRFLRDSENEIFGLGRVELDDYEVVDLNARYQFLDQLSGFVRIQNLFNEDYEEISGFNTAPASAFVGLSYSF